MQKQFCRYTLFVFLSFIAFVSKGAVHASFTTDHVAGCSPLVVSFTNTSTGDTTGFIWDLGDGAGLFTQTDEATTYTTPGTYTITLTAYNNSLDTSRITHTITVYPPPVVSFIVTDSTVCLGTPITFTNTSTGAHPPFTCKWSFGDGDTTSGSPVIDTYSSSGFYTIILTVTDSLGCTNLLTKPSYVHIFPVPTANFTVDYQLRCRVPTSPLFTDVVTGGTSPYSYKWYFGDGDSAMVHNPTHTYTQALGPTTVQLFVTDINGCSDSISRYHYIILDSNHSIAALVGPDTACLNSSIVLWDTSSTYTPSVAVALGTGTGGAITFADWPLYYVQYSTTGIKKVLLIKNDLYSCRDTAIHSIYVRSLAANFTITPRYPCPEPSTITVNGIAPPGTSVKYYWGDGSFTGWSDGPSTMGDTVSYTYTTTLDTTFPGHSTYRVLPVRMSVYDPYGCYFEIVKRDTIYNLLFDINSDVQEGCDSLTCHFTSTAKTNVPYLFSQVNYPRPIAHYFWDFGDGHYSSDTTPNHTFHGVGTYHVRCTLTTVDSCTAIDSMVIRVGQPDSVYYTATFDTSFTPGHMCFNTTVHFHAIVAHDSSYGQIRKYVWDYGDGSLPDTATTVDATHIFNSPGKFEVRVFSLNNGCPSYLSALQDSFIVDSPMARMSLTYSCDSPYLVHFTNSSLGASTLLWNFGDGDTTSVANPVHTYPPISALTTYTIQLVTYNSASHCADSTTKDARILNALVAFSATDTTICRDEKVKFHANDSGIVQFKWYVNTSLLATHGEGNDTFTHVFHDKGYDTVMLVTKDIHDCIDSISHIILTSKPVSHITANPTIGCLPFTVYFEDTSTFTPGTTPFKYLWTYYPGAATDTQTVDTTSFLYTGISFYGTPVTAIVIDNNGCRDTGYTTINKSYPFAYFGLLNGTDYCVGDTVRFFSNSFGGNIYSWAFGDGATSTAYLPSHQYLDTGTFTITLTVIDTTTIPDCPGSVSHTVHVHRPSASFTISDSFFVCPPVYLGAHNTSFGADTLTWTSSGFSSHFTDPVVTFDTGGVYTLQLVATDMYGCSDTARKQITVFGYPGDFSYPDSGCGPLSVHLHVTVPIADSIIWDFGDGNIFSGTLADSAINHIYISGTHIPKLVIRKSGCPSLPSVGTDTIKVDSVSAVFIATPDHVCPYQPVSFSASTSMSLFSTINSWHWLFSGTDTSTASAPFYTYNTAGTYPIKLLIADGWQCIDSTTRYVTVYGHEVTVSPPVTICYGESTTLTASGGITYEWFPATGLSCPTCPSPHASPLTTTTYTVVGVNSHGCNDTFTVTVTVNSLPIADVSASVSVVCPGSSSILTATGGLSYSWTPSATLSSGGGAVVSASPITATTYTVTATDINGCSNTDTITIGVYTPPTVTITTPVSSICPGTNTVLTASGATSYSWSPSGSLSSAIGSPVTASPAGSTTYSVIGTDIHGCKDTAGITVTVYPSPAITLIGSAGNGCLGTNVQLYDTVTGGFPGYNYLWNGPATFSSVIKNPVLTSLTLAMNGWYVLTVTDAHDCIKRDSTYVNIYTPDTFSVSGDTTICIGFQTLLTAIPSAGIGFIWAPSASLTCPACAATNAHPVATTTYTITGTNVHGCIDTESVTVHVNSLPVIPPITVKNTLCIYSTTTLFDSLSGGVWTSNDSAIVDIFGTTAVGTSAGTTIVTYTFTDSNGCTNFDTALMIVFPYTTLPPITGDTILCMGSTMVLHDSVTGGIWVTDDSAIAYIDTLTGVVTPVSVGYTEATYYVIDSNGCPSQGESFPYYVAPIPLVQPIVMEDTICIYDSTALVAPTPGGVWTCSDSSIANPYPPSGFVTGVSIGTATLTYSITNVWGCVGYATHTLTVIPRALVGPIYLPDTICIRNDITYATDSIPGGTWSVSDTSIAIIDSITGHINGMSGGTVIITYTVDNGYCQDIATDTITILTIAVAPIVGDTAVCIGQTTVFTDSTAGGFWLTAIPTIATIDSYGLFTTIDTGYTLIAYVVIDFAHSCLGFDTMSVYVAPLPVIPTFIVPDHLCIGDSAMLADTLTGGTWSSSDTSIAITSGDYVIGVSAGTVIITYSYTNIWGCSSFIVSDPITILSLPDAGIITGYDTLCLGGTTLLSETVPSGVWSSLDPTIADVDPFGLVTGLALGSAVIRYHFVDTACANDAYDTVYVITVPAIPPIIGADSGCIGTMYPMTDSLTGGTWYIIDGATSGTIDPVTGEFTAVHPGHVIIGYTVTTYCGDVSTTHNIWVIPPAPPIGGIRAVCSGSTTNLYNFIPGGVWSSENPAIADVDPATGVVTGYSTGTTTITYTATSICGTFTVTALVMVNMAPFITTNFIVACQDLGNGEFGTEHVITDSSGCILVCDSSVLRYYAHGVAGSSYTWVITGGNIITNYGDSIDVFWPSAGTTGSVTVYDTFSHCIGSATACIKVIHKPHALFSASSISVCRYGSIVFSNLSTGDSSLPITSMLWDFGDGSNSTTSSPSHTYTEGGTYVVTLIVRNVCNCSDTFRITITVDNIKGPTIYCPSIVCENETITYSVSNDCGPIWSINGGTILSGASNTITVKWDNLGPDNFGYVSMSNTCGACADTTSMKVPVIELNAAIHGQDVVCINEIYQYELPLWGGTEYMWGVLGSSVSVVGYRDDHTVLVRFTTPGTYVIHGWYQNIIKRCGGNVDKTITAVEPDFIIGDSVICSGTEGYYFAASGVYADWTITDPSGLTTTTYAAAIYPTFPTPGYYTLTANTGFCIKPFVVYVAGVPPVIDTVMGKDTVCLNRVYTYRAFADAANSIYNWQAIGGTVSPASGSPVVNVIWTSSGTKQLIVNRISTQPPYCAGPSDTIDIIQEVVPAGITGDTTPCVNTRRTYSINYTRGEVYDWSIYPDSAGSVVSGNHSRTCSVLWNNLLGSPVANVILSVRKCDSIFTDTLAVNLHGIALALSCSSGPACPNTPIVFHATPGDSAYVWNFGDGSPILVTSSDSALHSFPDNASSGNINYTILVTAIPGTSGNCPPIGSASIILPILPAPVAYASTAHPCIDLPPTPVIVGTVTNGITVTSFQWYGPLGTLGTATTQLAADTGLYYFVVVADNGCQSTSGTVQISHCGGGGCGSSYDPTISSSVSCNTVSLVGDAGAPSPYWSAALTPVSSTTSGVNATYTYDVPGIYLFDFHYTGCHENIYDTILFVPAFDYRFKCAVGGIDSVFISDHTAYMPWVTLGTISWTVDGIPAGIGNNITQLLPALSTHTVVETVTTSAGTCTRTKIISLPARPHVSFTDTVVPICSGVPVQFIATDTAGIISYHWDFGDFSNIVMRNPQRTFTYEVGASPSNNFQVTLSVTDSFGCTADTMQTVQIFKNQLHGQLMDSIIVCSDDPATLQYDVFTLPFPTYLLWSTGTTSYYPVVTENVLESGSYWVTLFDNYRCQLTLPTEMVKILQTPTAEISGRESYCLGDDVVLNGFAGLSNTYQWYVDGTPQAATPFIRMTGLPGGSYAFQLVVGTFDSVSNVTCYDTSTVHIIQVHRVPVPVIDTILADCSQYHIQLHAADSAGGTFRWSNGTMGATTDIYNGGSYRVWFTDDQGCEVYADAFIPKSPEYYFQYLPAGCYKICYQQLPITLYGPPHVPFPHWEWWMDGLIVDLGSSMMNPFTIAGDGSYQWLLNNGLCEQVSDPMEIEIIKCADCDNFIKYVGISFACDTSAASYSGTIDIIPNIPGITFNIGTESGPINPFSDTLAMGLNTLSVTFTTFDYGPPSPSIVIVEIEFTLPNGQKCFKKMKIKLPDCTWIKEKGVNTDSLKTGIKNHVATAMMVFPNPASQEVNISYDYGAAGYIERNISVYDQYGRKTQETVPDTDHGSWKLNTSNWTPGMYIIRMEGDGKTLQTQRLIVSN